MFSLLLIWYLCTHQTTAVETKSYVYSFIRQRRTFTFYFRVFVRLASWIRLNWKRNPVSFARLGEFFYIFCIIYIWHWIFLFLKPYLYKFYRYQIVELFRLICICEISSIDNRAIICCPVKYESNHRVDTMDRILKVLKIYTY